MFAQSHPLASLPNTSLGVYGTCYESQEIFDRNSKFFEKKKKNLTNFCRGISRAFASKFFKYFLKSLKK